MQKYGVTNVSQLDSVKKQKVETVFKHWGVSNPKQSAEIQEKITQTMVERYGVPHPLQNDALKGKVKETNIHRYGVENPAQNDKVRAKVRAKVLKKYGVPCVLQSTLVREKIKKTCDRKYGSPAPLGNSVIREKLKATNRQRYGTDYVGSSPQIQEKIVTTKRLRTFGERAEEIQAPDFWKAEYVDGKKSIVQIASELGLTNSYVGKLLHKYAPTIEIRPGDWISAQEVEILNFLKKVYEGPIQQQVWLTNLKKQDPEVRRFSLDLYLPELNLAIEHNGLYWHSNLAPHIYPRYHLDKTEACEFLGIRLIHIWEDDWRDKRPLMEAKLKYLLGVSTAERLHARKLSVTVPTNRQKKAFYNAYHIKGNGAGSVTYALVQDSLIVAMITFKLVTKRDKSQWDLNRFAVHSSYQIPGAFTKLLAHFIRTNQWTSIITYADRDWATGKVYEQAGFKRDLKNPTTPPAFCGVELRKGMNKRISRRAYTHPRLKQKLAEAYDSKKSQLQLMAQAQIPVIYNCGNYKFVLYNQNNPHFSSTITPPPSKS
jgi:hypothetical protein